MSDTGKRSTRVIFTFDRLNSGGKNCYTRITLRKPNLQQITINDNNKIAIDPVIDYLTNRETLLSDFEDDGGLEISFDIDVLVINNNLDDSDNGFKQYRANFNSVVEKPFVSINGISEKIWRSWCIRLFFNGEFDGDYKYEIIKRNEKFEWVVKVEHGGIWKVVFIIGMAEVDIDIDEYFIEDLESFYGQINIWKRRAKEWELEREKKVIDMGYLSKIDGLRKSARELKEKVLKGYTPLVNHLLRDRILLKRKLDDAGEVMFSSVRKRKPPAQTLDTNHPDEYRKIIDNLNRKRKKKDKTDTKFDKTKQIESGEKTSEDENNIFTFNSTKRKPTSNIRKDNINKTSDSFSEFGSSSGENCSVQSIYDNRILETTPKEIIKENVITETNQLQNSLSIPVNYVSKMEILNETHLSGDDEKLPIVSQELQGQSNNSIEISEETFIEEPNGDYVTEDIDSDKTDA